MVEPKVTPGFRTKEVYDMAHFYAQEVWESDGEARSHHFEVVDKHSFKTVAIYSARLNAVAACRIEEAKVSGWPTCPSCGASMMMASPNNTDNCVPDWLECVDCGMQIVTEDVQKDADTQGTNVS